MLKLFYRKNYKLFLVFFLLSISLNACGLLSDKNLPEKEITFGLEDKELEKTSEGWYRFMLAELALKNDDIETAIKNFTLSNNLLEDPSYRMSQKLAVLQYKAGDLESALHESDKAIISNPNDYKSWVLRGGILETKNDIQGAIDNYNQAISLAPSASEPVVLKAGLLYRIEHKQDAKLLLNDYIKNNADSFTALSLLARIYEEEKDFTLAKYNWEKAWEQSNQDISLGLDYVRFLLRTNKLYEENLKKAKKITLQLLSRYPNNIFAIRTYAQILYTEGNIDGSITQIQVAVNKSQNQNLLKENFDLRYELSLLYVKGNKIPQAIKLLETLLGEDPKRDDLRFTLANLYSTQLQYKKALDQTNKVKPDSQFYLKSEVLKALLYYQTKEPQKSLAVIKRIKKAIDKDNYKNISDYINQLEQVINDDNLDKNNN